MNAILRTKADKLAEASHQAAAASFYVAKACGRESPEHKAMMAAYEFAKRLYEQACAEEGRPAYATYDGD